MKKRILKAKGSFYLPMKDGETEEEAMDRFDKIVCVDNIEFASYNVYIINENGDVLYPKEQEGLKLSWPEGSDAYTAVENIVIPKYEVSDIIVQLRSKYDWEINYRDHTELLINDGKDYSHPKYIWQNDWWEGEQDVILVAAARVEDIKLGDKWKIKE